MSDISTLVAKFAHVFSSIPFNKTLGMELSSIEKDFIILQFNMKKELIGNFLHGILHGGVISSVLDMAGGTVAMLSVIEKKMPKTLEELSAAVGKSSTISLHVDYLRPGKGERFIAKAWLLKSGNKIAFTRMELHSDADVLIATGTATYLIS